MDMCENHKDTVDVPIEKYKELIKDQEILRALEAGGVGDWEWYDDSLENIRQED